MIEFIRITNPFSDNFTYALSVLKESFPREEYRDTVEWAQHTQTKDIFHNTVIRCNGENFGILTYWNFSTFIYIEHFAIEQNKRKGGIGTMVLRHFLKGVDKPIVLEVEIPDNPIAVRRIKFYNRLGLNLEPYNYIQPPYRKGGDMLHLRIMTNRAFHNLSEFKNVQQTLYRYVYSYIGKIGGHCTDYHKNDKKNDTN